MAEAIDPIKWFRRASPYIYLHRQKTFVLCVDQAAMRSPNFNNVLRDVTLLHALGVRIVLVHDLETPEFVEEQTGHQAPIANESQLSELMANIGGATHQVIASLSANAHHASPFYSDLVACTGNFIRAQPLGVMGGHDQGFKGKPRKVNKSAIAALLDDDMLVVIPPVGYALTGETFILNCQSLAGEVAKALHADKLIYFLPSHGLVDDAGHRISERSTTQLEDDDDSLASGIKQGIKSALTDQSNRCHLVSYAHDGALLEELFTMTGSGTIVTPGPAVIRSAVAEDVEAMLELIRPLERSGALIERSRDDLDQNLADYLVVDLEGQLIGCGALHEFGDTAEIASLATDPHHRDQDYGERLLSSLLHRAMQRGVKAVFVLTTQTEHWFLERGFMRAEKDHLPAPKLAKYNSQRNSKVLIRPL